MVMLAIFWLFWLLMFVWRVRCPVLALGVVFLAVILPVRWIVSCMCRGLRKCVWALVRRKFWMMWGW